MRRPCPGACCRLCLHGGRRTTASGDDPRFGSHRACGPASGAGAPRRAAQGTDEWLRGTDERLSV